MSTRVVSQHDKAAAIVIEEIRVVLLRLADEYTGESDHREVQTAIYSCLCLAAALQVTAWCMRQGLEKKDLPDDLPF